MSIDRAQHTTRIAAPPDACFAAFLDFESYPEWQSSVKACTVLERDAEGRGSLIETAIDLKVRQVRYVLRYHYEPPTRMWWDYVEGDVKAIEGEFVAADNGDGTTDATYAIGVDIGGFVPGRLKRTVADVALRQVLKDLAKRVERP
jgi:ribosome-associated toxin RatA of RatAB toxin-antitoxin module